jgi:hypothetical protein
MIDFEKDVDEDLRNEFNDKVFELVESFGATCCGMSRLFTENEWLNHDE